ncbi:Small conductance calcium-activated potassium channel protein 2 [Cichlidogyrus casuarinus]|uniref:Small conductance calcium-activated potassium channel protein 2 n=1 Tax=Cichlidogyrus casuarinus TaxID=1844966 RepID=A0ABD2QIK3_9PLAT
MHNFQLTKNQSENEALLPFLRPQQASAKLDENASTISSLCARSPCTKCGLDMQQIMRMLYQHSCCHGHSQHHQCGHQSNDIPKVRNSNSIASEDPAETQKLFGTDAPAAAYALAWAIGPHASSKRPNRIRSSSFVGLDNSPGSHKADGADLATYGAAKTESRYLLQKIGSTVRDTPGGIKVRGGSLIQLAPYQNSLRDRERIFNQLMANGQFPSNRAKIASSKSQDNSTLAALMGQATAQAMSTAAAVTGQKSCEEKMTSQTDGNSSSNEEEQQSTSCESQEDSITPPLISERVRQRRGAGEVRRIGAPGGPLGSGVVQPLVGLKEAQYGRGAQSRSIGWRLSRRKKLNERRKRISDYSLAFALFGLGVVILETEFTMTGIYTKVIHL